MNTTTKCTRAESRIVVKATIEEVMKRIKDPTRIADFHPLIRASYPASDEGSDRVCEFIPMGVAREKITLTDDGLKAEFTGGDRMPPISTMRGRLVMVPSAQGTEVSFVLEYSMKPGILPAVMNALAVKKQFTRAPAYYVAGLKHLVEQGTKATKKDLKRLGWIDG